MVEEWSMPRAPEMSDEEWLDYRLHVLATGYERCQEELRKSTVRIQGLQRFVETYHERNLHPRVRRLELRLKEAS